MESTWGQEPLWYPSIAPFIGTYCDKSPWPLILYNFDVLISPSKRSTLPTIAWTFWHVLEEDWHLVNNAFIYTPVYIWTTYFVIKFNKHKYIKHIFIRFKTVQLLIYYVSLAEDCKALHHYIVLVRNIQIKKQKNVLDQSQIWNLKLLPHVCYHHYYCNINNINVSSCLNVSYYYMTNA